MRVIKRLEECYIESFVEIAANAYPANGIFAKEDKERFKNNIIKTQNEKPNVNFYGVFEDSTLFGGMSYHDFNMNLLSQKIKAGGVGCIAVDLIHKKEKVAIDIIKDFIYHYRNQGAPMALLYPFRPDFYKKMGFGFGTSINQFRVKPCNLPKGTSKMHIQFLNIEDLHELCNFYNKMVMRTNGLIEKYDYEFKILFNNASNKILAYKVKDEIKGYVVFQFKKGDTEAFTINDIVIKEFLYEDPEVFLEFMTFFNSQNDQIRYILFNTQDENFRFALEDPRDGADIILTGVYHQCSRQGIGIMYRVIDVFKLFKDLESHNFKNQNCRLKLTITDTLIKENNGSYIIHFNDGKATLNKNKDFDVELMMDISDFSSLITCVVDINSLYRYGKIKISNIEYLKVLNEIFSSDEKPICMTQF